MRQQRVGKAGHGGTRTSKNPPPSSIHDNTYVPCHQCDAIRMQCTHTPIQSHEQREGGRVSQCWEGCSLARSVDLDVPLLVLLPALEDVLPGLALALSHALEHLQYPRHHALEPAEVHVCALVHPVKDLLGVLLHLVLDVHLAALLVVLLTGQRVVQPELVRVLLQDRLPLLVVQQTVAVGHPQEQPRQALESVAGRRLLHKQAAQEPSVRRDAGAGGDHDEVRSRFVLRHEHHLARRAGQLEFVTGLRVTQVVGAHALLLRHLLARLGVIVDGPPHAQRGRVASHVVAVACGRDRVQPDALRLAVLGVDAWRDDAVGLSLPVGHLAVMVDDDVTGLSGGLFAHNPLDAHDLADAGCLFAVGVDGDVGHVIVGGRLEEVLLGLHVGPLVPLRPHPQVLQTAHHLLGSGGEEGETAAEQQASEEGEEELHDAARRRSTTTL
mmetsp:Transcript_41962/g.104771  ORF Transcript_41962/g.104771 Transcript_41962/m.104771 type:complete len:440 (-) Transcript_41962:9-1328(-)